MRAPAPGVLRGVAGNVGGAHEFGNAVLTGAEFEHADAGTDMEHALVPAKTQRVQRLMDGIGNPPGMRQIAVREDDSEFVAAEARQQVGVAHLLLHDAADLLQHFVAGHVSGDVVDHLELVEIDVQQHMRIRAAARG